MYFKVIFLAALVYIVSADHGFSSQEIKKHDDHHKEVHVDHYHDYYTHPKYEFDYKVNDPHTHDQKEQHETRDGDVVKGYYKLLQPDGIIREVHYHSDDHSGYHADVKQSVHHIVPIKHHE